VSPLAFESENVDSIVRVRLDGELDLSSAPQFERYLMGLETESDALIEVDLRRLEFMDSTGLRLILSADARAKERGGRLRLIQGPAAVQRVFRIAGLDERLQFSSLGLDEGA
jgi:anti-sigma B factor antagonist